MRRREDGKNENYFAFTANTELWKCLQQLEQKIVITDSLCMVPSKIDVTTEKKTKKNLLIPNYIFIRLLSNFVQTCDKCVIGKCTAINWSISIVLIQYYILLREFIIQIRWNIHRISNISIWQSKRSFGRHLGFLNAIQNIQINSPKIWTFRKKTIFNIKNYIEIFKIFTIFTSFLIWYIPLDILSQS